MQRGFTLWRQDDNGVIARVARYPDQLAAEKARAKYEASGHKQHYWIEPDDDTCSPPAGH
ncbi:hypothetical protein Y5S_00359 [Alcanivorax nanhaiticus]|uniref:SPOR domain-containing protein n=1 Tax=Alcanivorax nanhaiticus TaxID=1177154 RepID=A0A095SQ59_9GAMM|nr:hypothetical protein Y5S_00359 [Alcanivorax nanhaiticus]